MRPLLHPIRPLQHHLPVLRLPVGLRLLPLPVHLHHRNLRLPIRRHLLDRLPVGLRHHHRGHHHHRRPLLLPIQESPTPGPAGTASCAMTQGGMRCMCILVETLDVVACVEANRQLGARGRRTAGALGRSSQLAAVPLAPPPRRRVTLPLVTSAPTLSFLATAPNSARERQRRVEGAAQEDSGRIRQGQAASPALSSPNGGVRGRGGRNTDDSLLTLARAASTTATARPARRTRSRTTAIANTASAATATIRASSIICNTNSTTADNSTAGTPTASTTTSGHATITDVAGRPGRTAPATATTTASTSSTATSSTSDRTSASASASASDTTTAAGSTAGARTGSTPIDGGATTATTTNLLWRGDSNTSTSARSKRRSTRSAAEDHDGHRSPPTASSSPRTPTTHSNSERATSGRQASTEPLAQSLAPPPPTVASTSTVFPGKWVESGGFECGVDGRGGRSNPGALECSGCTQSLRKGWAFGAGRDSVTEIKLLDEVTFRGRNGFTYTGFIVALNGSTEIFPDGSALVKHFDALYKRDRFDEDVALSRITPPGCTGGSAKRVRKKVDRLMNSSSS